MITYVLLLCAGCLTLSYVMMLLKKIWWNPIQLQSKMRLQGIKGPSYRFFHGNSKQILSMITTAKAYPIHHLSHHQVFPTVLPHIYAWTKLYGKNFLSWRGTQAQLTVTEIELIKEILNNKDGIFPKTRPKVFLKKLIGDGIISTSGDKWSKLRKLSNHAFHSDSLKGMVPAMIESVEMMLERWSQNYAEQEIEVYKEFKVLTSEIISRTAFGSSYLEGQHIFDMLIQLTSIIYQNNHKIRIPGIGSLVKTKDDRESDKIEEEMRKCIMNLIKKREELAENEQLGSYGDDFLGLLVKAYNENEESKKISVDDLVDECKSFYVAGQETSASSLTWTLFLLATHSDWQHRARQEVLHLLGTHNNPCPQTLPKFKILNMIINEAIRLYPPVSLLTRRVQRQVKLGEMTIPENVQIEIPIPALHYDSEIWGKDVDEFKPERFAEGIAKATNVNNNVAAAYLPFGLGARSCVGSNFALTETKIPLAMILQRYSFVLSPTYVHSPFMFLTMSPQHGLQIILHPL